MMALSDWIQLGLSIIAFAVGLAATYSKINAKMERMDEHLKGVDQHLGRLDSDMVRTMDRIWNGMHRGGGGSRGS